QLSHLETALILGPDVEALAVASWCQENAVPVLRTHRLAEDRLQFDDGLPRFQMRRPEVLEPTLRGFDRVQEPRAVVRGINGPALGPLDDERALHEDPRRIRVRAEECTSKPGTVHTDAAEAGGRIGGAEDAVAVVVAGVATPSPNAAQSVCGRPTV